MKKSLLLFCLLAFSAFSGCTPDENDAGTGIPPVCNIISPEDGTEFKWGDAIIIRGEAEDEDGIISDVLLEINGTAVENVKMIPFEYEVEEQYVSPGIMSIRLTVTDNSQLTASDEISVTVGDVPESPVCEIQSPEDGAEFEFEDEIRITGSGSDPDGEIAKTEITVNGKVVPEITAVPFDWTMNEEFKQEGAVELVLTVTDMDGLAATDTVRFTILGQFRTVTDSRDGKSYATVKIGEQEWFAENLAYLPVVNLPSDNSDSEPRYYVYGYDGEDVAAAKETENYKNLGVLYNWTAAGGDKELGIDEVSTLQGPCPDGWHVPSLTEWEILFQYVRDRIPEDEAATYWDGSLVYNVNGHLRSKEGWPIAPDDDFPQLAQSGFDTYGFCVKLSGQYLPTSPYFFYGAEDGGNSAIFWTPCYDDITYPDYPGGVSVCIANYRYEPSISQGSAIQRGYNVRCLKD